MPTPYSQALGPLVLTTISTAVTGIFPAFVSYRFYRNEQDLPATKQEKYIQYGIIICLTFLHLAEAAKAAYFGLLYSNANYLLSFVPRLALQYVINILTELGHIFLVAVVVMRMAGLVDIRRKSFISHDQPTHDVYSLIGYAITITRSAVPLVALIMRREVSAFGAYSILTLVLEIFIFIFATVVISRLLSQLQKDDDLHIPTWRLFSNPIVTGSLVSISFLTLVVMAATYSAAYEGTWNIVTNPGPLMMPSFYGMLVGLTLIMYQDTKILIFEAKTPSGRLPSPSKKKIEHADLFQ